MRVRDALRGLGIRVPDRRSNRLPAARRSTVKRQAEHTSEELGLTDAFTIEYNVDEGTTMFLRELWAVTATSCYAIMQVLVAYTVLTMYAPRYDPSPFADVIESYLVFILTAWPDELLLTVSETTPMQNAALTQAVVSLPVALLLVGGVYVWVKRRVSTGFSITPVETDTRSNTAVEAYKSTSDNDVVFILRNTRNEWVRVTGYHYQDKHRPGSAERKHVIVTDYEMRDFKHEFGGFEARDFTRVDADDYEITESWRNGSVLTTTPRMATHTA